MTKSAYRKALEVGQFGFAEKPTFGEPGTDLEGIVNARNPGS